MSDTTDTLPTTAPGLAIDTSGPIRRFVDSRLQASVAEIFAGIPEDKPVAVIAVAGKEGASLVVAARLGSGFSLCGILDKKWKGELTAQAALVWVPE